MTDGKYLNPVGVRKRQELHVPNHVCIPVIPHPGHWMSSFGYKQISLLLVHFWVLKRNDFLKRNKENKASLHMGNASTINEK